MTITFQDPTVKIPQPEPKRLRVGRAPLSPEGAQVRVVTRVRPSVVAKLEEHASRRGITPYELMREILETWDSQA